MMDQAKEMLGDLIEWESLSEQQCWVLNERACGVSVHNICEKWKERFNSSTILSCEAFTHCIMRAVQGYTWVKGLETGRLPYLCYADMKELEKQVEVACEVEEYFDISSVLECARKLKIIRRQKASQALWKLSHQNLARKLRVEPLAPSRPWANTLEEYINVRLSDVIDVNSDRFTSCHIDGIDDYLNKYRSLLDSTPECLLFGADETQLSPIVSGKVVISADLMNALREGLPDLPQVTALCCHNLCGTHVPLFIILKQLQKLPEELKCFSETGRAWFASSRKGFMTRDLFLIWSFHFINWMTSYRLSLEPKFRNAQALLILDGHLSRECPLALMFLKSHNIEVLILPSHTTHVLQIFDVALAAPLKTMFGRLFREQLSNTEHVFQSNAAKLRFSAVFAVICAWESTCNLSNCKNGAKATGTKPCCTASELSSPYVHRLSGKALEQYNRRKEYSESHHTIGGRIITKENELEEIRSHVMNTGIHTHLGIPVLTRNGNIATYFDHIRYFCKNFFNGAKLLSTVPPYFGIGMVPVLFDSV